MSNVLQMPSLEAFCAKINMPAAGPTPIQKCTAPRNHVHSLLWLRMADGSIAVRWQILDSLSLEPRMPLLHQRTKRVAAYIRPTADNRRDPVLSDIDAAVAQTINMNIHCPGGRSIFASTSPLLPSPLEEQRNGGLRNSARQAMRSASGKDLNKPENYPTSERISSVRGISKKSSQSRPKRAAAGIRSPVRPSQKQRDRMTRSLRPSTTVKRHDVKNKLSTTRSLLAITTDLEKRPFPVKLFDMLKDCEDRGLSDVVGWQKHGRAIRVHDPHRFVTGVLPYYFRQSKITSFQVRELLMLR